VQLSSGGVAQAIRAQPPALRGVVAGAARAGYANALNEILLISGCIAAFAAIVSLVAIRSRDFHGADEAAGEAPDAIPSHALAA
jgi:hypothetical protein